MSGEGRSWASGGPSQHGDAAMNDGNSGGHNYTRHFYSFASPDLSTSISESYHTNLSSNALINAGFIVSLLEGVLHSVSPVADDKLVGPGPGQARPGPGQTVTIGLNDECRGEGCQRQECQRSQRYLSRLVFNKIE